MSLPWQALLHPEFFEAEKAAYPVVRAPQDVCHENEISHPASGERSNISARA
jgi:hypothetical protein